MHFDTMHLKPYITDSINATVIILYLILKTLLNLSTSILEKRETKPQDPVPSVTSMSYGSDTVLMTIMEDKTTDEIP